MELIQKTYAFSNTDLDYDGYICVTSKNSQGISFGGCRFSLGVTQAEVEELALCMSLKLFKHGLPMGGAKGGLRVDPLRPDMNLVLADFAHQANDVLKNQVVLGKDLGATNPIMDTLYKEAQIPQLYLSQKHNGFDPSVPGRIRDLTGYVPHMTGLGVSYATSAALGDRLKGMRISIQGAGFVGMGAAFRIQALGGIIVGMSDVKTSLYCEEGLSFEDLQVIVEGGVINPDTVSQKFPKVEMGDSERLFDQNSDVLILAANSNSVSSAMAEKIKAEVIVEGANFGLTMESRDILFKKDVLVIPDILSNCSSAAMTSFQISSGNALSSHDLWGRIEKAVKQTVIATVCRAQSEKTSVREAYLNLVVPQNKNHLLSTKVA